MPTTVPTRPLYCGTCIKDLTNKIEYKLDGKDPKKVCKSLGRLLDEAKKYRLIGDEEMTYIYFMRWLHCIQWLQKTPDYSTNHDFLKPYVSGSQVKEILDLVQEMSEKLKERYNAEKLKNSTEKMMNTVEKMKIEPDHTNNDDLLDEIGDVELTLPDTPTDDPANEEPETAITCIEMYQEMHKLGDRIIIIDIRSKGDFQNSHIKSGRCINIPSDLIKTGILATRVFTSLKGDEKTCRIIRHRAREYCDLIVLLDWQTTKASLKSGDQLNVLKTILLHWDPGQAYRKIVILDGGYKEWLSRFPTFTTNPNITAPDFDGNDSTELLEDVKYPDWNPSDEDEPMPEVKFRPVPARNLKPTLNDKKDTMNRNTKILNNQNTEWTKPPQITTENIYPINALGSMKVEKNISDEVLIDGTKPPPPRSVVVGENINENDSKFSRNSTVNRVIAKPTEKDIAKPAIDRSSKPSSEKIYDIDSKKMLNLLEHKKDLTNSQLKLEKDLLIASRLFGSENDEDVDSVQNAETRKQMATLNSAITQKVEQISAIKEKLEKYKEDGIEVSPVHFDEKVQLEVDIGLAETEARTLAIKRKEIISEREKKMEEILELKRRNLSTPPNEPERDTVKAPLKQDGLSMNSSLKRSYSSPNLAQMESRKESIGRGLDTKIPQVDRTSKPLQQQYRNNNPSSTGNNKAPFRRDREQIMNPVYGTVRLIRRMRLQFNCSENLESFQSHLPSCRRRFVAAKNTNFSHTPFNIVFCCLISGLMFLVMLL